MLYLVSSNCWLAYRLIGRKDSTYKLSLPENRPTTEPDETDLSEKHLPVKAVVLIMLDYGQYILRDKYV